MSRRRICVVTGSRAEYGLLCPLMKAVREDPELKLQVVATGMHLSPEFGSTYREIEEDGFRIDEKVETLLSSDTPVGVAKSIGLGIIGFADALDRLKPDLLVLLGDRYEVLAAAQAAMVAGIPIAHIAGGDLTEGAFDEAIRHSITKMSHLHFATLEESARRLRRLGENPDNIFVVGSPAIDRLKELRLLGRGELERELGFRFRGRNLLVTFHPPTLEAKPAGDQFRELLAALDGLGPEVGLIFTRPNADPEGRTLIRMIDAFVDGHPNAAVFTSLGQRLYFSVVAQVDAVVGNSSSGIYEVPSLGKPTVNIGDRQKGRPQASSVINCPPEAESIASAIREAFGRDCSKVRNPYGDGGSAARILAVLKGVADPRSLIKKRFFETDGRG
jgi:UDP-N-acetylglucosamine 2-epimerase (non-hydrolysing)/GDP/UDP-N,N'-diacetylbacillosamine 2-epimerase (hydrolysing)